MSEYQYYEFLAVDRPLTQKQIDEVREFSSRAEISATRFVNEYHWGDFRGDPHLLVTKYFDLMVYLANWGTHQLLMGMPADDAMIKAWKIYESDEGVLISRSGGRVIVNLVSQEEASEYEEDSGGWIASLAPIREELLIGDERPLYLAWLAGVPMLDEDSDAAPIPLGLNELTTAQRSLAEYLRVDEDLLAAAQAQSESVKAASGDLAEYIAALPAPRKDQILLSIASGDDPHGGARLLREFRKSIEPSHASQSRQLSLKQLMESAQQLREEREAGERDRAARESERRRAEQAAQRQKHLNEVAAQQEKVWRQAEDEIQRKNSGAYDRAIELLADLRDVAVRDQSFGQFSAKLERICEAHRSKPSFMDRLRRKGLFQMPEVK